MQAPGRSVGCSRYGSIPGNGDGMCGPPLDRISVPRRRRRARYSPAPQYTPRPRAAPGSGCSAPRPRGGGGRARRCRSAGRHALDRPGVGAEVGRARAAGSMPGRFTTTIVASSAIRSGRRQRGGRPGCRRRSGRTGRRRAGRGGRLPASRRCNAGRGRCASTSETSNAGCPAVAIRAISSRSATGVRPARLVRRRARPPRTRPGPAARLAARLGQDQVPQVDRVERPAEQAQAHRGSILGQ